MVDHVSSFHHFFMAATRPGFRTMTALLESRKQGTASNRESQNLRINLWNGLLAVEPVLNLLMKEEDSRGCS